MEFFFQLGVYFNPINIALIILCSVLIFKKTKYESCIRILFYPCLLVSLFSALLLYTILAELFVAYYSGGKYEKEAFKLRFTGPYAWYYRMFVIGTIIPMFLILPPFRKSALTVLIIAIITFTLRMADKLEFL